jgi:hypothetical protein
VLAATSSPTVFPGVYIMDVGAPVLITVPGANYYSEVAFINNNTVVFAAGPSRTGQDIYRHSLLTDTTLRLTNTGNILTRGQAWSLNKNWWYFVRSNAASTVNNIVGVHAGTGSLKDITGGEFSGGTAPAIRTGSFNTSADPWLGLDMQLRLGNDGYAFFAARRETGVAGTFADANIFRFDMEVGAQAEMLTSNAGSGPNVGSILAIENLALSDDTKIVAWSQRLGISATASEDVFYVASAGGLPRQVSLSQATGQTITDGSIFFTCNPTSGLTWSIGTGSTSVPLQESRVEWAPLGGPTIPLVVSPRPLGTRLYQVIGVHD